MKRRKEKLFPQLYPHSAKRQLPSYPFHSEN
jgi:hypothetical protein